MLGRKGGKGGGGGGTAIVVAPANSMIMAEKCTKNDISM
jgi:acetyl-CoA carboxylase alpha subunit